MIKLLEDERYECGCGTIHDSLEHFIFVGSDTVCEECIDNYEVVDDGYGGFVLLDR